MCTLWYEDRNQFCLPCPSVSYLIPYSRIIDFNESYTRTHTHTLHFKLKFQFSISFIDADIKSSLIAYITYETKYPYLHNISLQHISIDSRFNTHKQKFTYILTLRCTLKRLADIIPALSNFMFIFYWDLKLKFTLIIRLIQHTGIIEFCKDFNCLYIILNVYIANAAKVVLIFYLFIYRRNMISPLSYHFVL